MDLDKAETAPETNEDKSESEGKEGGFKPGYTLQLKWKKREWWLLMAFNGSMVILLGCTRLLTESDEKTKWISMAVMLPILFTLLIYYMWKTISHHRDHETIIKPGRIKYFRIGSGSSFLSFLFAATGFAVSNTVSDQVAKIVVYVFIAVCILLGVISSIFTSMYGFCSEFDVYYHKNKETIIKTYLEMNKNKFSSGDETKDTEDEGSDFKILGGEEIDED